MNFTLGLNINGRRGFAYLPVGNTCSATHDNNSCIESPQSTTTAPPVQYTIGNDTPIDIAKLYTNAPPVNYRDHLVGNGTPNDIAKVVPPNFYTIGM